MVYEIILASIVLIVVCYIVFFPQSLIKRAYIKTAYRNTGFTNWETLVSSRDIDQVYKKAVLDAIQIQLRQKSNSFYMNRDKFESEMVNQFLTIMKDGLKEVRSEGKNLIEDVLDSTLHQWSQRLSHDIHEDMRHNAKRIIDEHWDKLNNEKFLDDVITRINKKQLGK